jgi:glycosyltransferase involved in cell wall biosynthesis
LNKKRLLIWSDSPTVKTGFGIVAENLFRDLHEDFEVAILGVNYYGIHRFDTEKYFIYPVDQQDMLGFDRMSKVLPDFNPDVILLFQDIFNIDIMLPIIKRWNDKVPVVAYFPIDGTPVSKSWLGAFMGANRLITYTQWGVSKIKEAHPELASTSIEYLYHGVDITEYKPLSRSEVEIVQKQRGWDDKFVIFSNNRFQPRKNLASILRIHALFAKGYKECKCGGVYLASRPACDLNGCGPEDIIAQHTGHDDVMMYVHANTQERMMGPGRANLLHAHMINAGFENKDVNRIISAFSGNVYANPLPESEMNMLYNIASVNVSTTFGEGVGLSLVESAAAGTTSIAPRNSAIPEMLGDTGHLIPNVAHVNIAFDNAHVRPVVATKPFITALEAEYQKWIANGRKKIVNEAAVDRVHKLFLWDDKRTIVRDWMKQYV